VANALQQENGTNGKSATDGSHTSNQSLSLFTRRGEPGSAATEHIAETAQKIMPSESMTGGFLVEGFCSATLP